MKTNTYRKRRAATPITPGQRSTIMLICNQYDISKVERAAMLQDRFKKSSTADLTATEAGSFIKEFEEKGFVIIQKQNTAPRRPRPEIPRNKGKVVALANQNERDKINAVSELIQWREVNGLALFLEKRMGIKEGTVRTSEEAYLAIEGLKKMFENGMKKQHGPAWWRMAFTDPRIVEYIRQHCPDQWR